MSDETNIGVDLTQYRAALAEHWQGKSITRTQLATIVQDHLGLAMTGSRPVLESWTNEVHQVTVTGGAVYAVRLARRRHDRFPAEAWALREAVKAGIPVPEVIVCSRVEEPEPLEVCIQHWMDGERLLWIAAGLGKNDTCRLGSEAGALLARIHQIPVEGFGLVDGAGRAPHQCLSDDRHSTLGDTELIRETGQRLGIDRSLVEEALQAATTTEPSQHAVLAHGDFAIKHLVIRHGQLRGILDFETARGSDRAYDIAIWDLINGPDPSRACLADGYRHAGGDFSETSVARWRCTLRLRALADNQDWYRHRSTFEVRNALTDDVRESL